MGWRQNTHTHMNTYTRLAAAAKRITRNEMPCPFISFYICTLWVLSSLHLEICFSLASPYTRLRARFHQSFCVKSPRVVLFCSSPLRLPIHQSFPCWLFHALLLLVFSPVILLRLNPKPPPFIPSTHSYIFCTLLHPANRFFPPFLFLQLSYRI